MALTILKRHPGLRTSGDGERYAGWLELFYDLVYVLAVAELARYLHDHLNFHGFLGYTGLFVAIWWTWIGFSFYADQFDPDDLAYRIVMLVAMLFSIILAVNIQVALTANATDFIVAYTALQALLTGLYLWGRRDPDARWFCTRFAIGFSVGTILWLISLWIPTPARYVVWALALIIEIITPVVVALSLKSRLYYVSHIPERLGIFTLIVLGESIVQVGSGLVGTHWQPSSIGTAIGSFFIAACLWWIYFDRVNSEIMERALTGSKWEMIRSFTWSYVHLAIFAGLTATSVGISLAISEASSVLDAAARSVLCLGIATALLAAVLIHQLGPQPLSRSELTVRCTAAAVAILLTLVGLQLGSLLVIGLLAFLLVMIIVFEVIHFKQSDDEKTEPDTVPERTATHDLDEPEQPSRA